MPMTKTNKWNMQEAMHGALLLTIATFIVKVLSVVYRVPFQNMVGDAGFYMYQQVYPFVGIFVAWTSYGYSVALSKWLAESTNEMEREKRTQLGFIYVTLLMIFIFIFLYTNATTLAKAMGDEALAPLLQTSSWLALIVPFLATLKGSFQARGQFRPIAYANVFEQVVRVSIILVGAYFVVQMSRPLYEAAQFALFGSVIGAIVGTLWLLRYVQTFQWSRLSVREFFQGSKKLTIYSMSFSLSALLLLLFQLVDSFTIVNTLVTQGVAFSTAIVEKGIFDRGHPFVQVGLLVATTLSLALVPLVARKETTEKDKRATHRYVIVAFQIAIAFGVAATLGLMIVLNDLNVFLFKENVGYVPLLLFVGQIFWLSLLLPMTAILQGRGYLFVPFLIYSIGLLVKGSTASFFITHWQTSGAALGSHVSLFIMTVLLSSYFYYHLPMRLIRPTFVYKLCKASIALIGVTLLWKYMMHFIGSEGRLFAMWMTLSTALIGSVTFGYMIIRDEMFQVREWLLLPKGDIFARWQLAVRRKDGKK